MQPVRLSLTFRILTPMFIGGAEGKAGPPELRAPSIKGMLRFWYRALDPMWQKSINPKHEKLKKITREVAWFGGCASNAGQSPFLIMLNNVPSVNPVSFPNRVGQGLAYIGYPFKGWRDAPSRQAIPSNQTFTLDICVIRCLDSPGFRRALTASLWCMGNLGALGSRNRRGFGALALESWKVKTGDWPEFEQLALLSMHETAKAWLTAFDKNLETIGDWFNWKEQTSESTKPSHRPQPHFGQKYKRRLQGKAFKLEDWQGILDYMGGWLQQYRSRRSPDYENVKNYIDRRVPLKHAPQRAAFGLPITFRYRSLPGSRPVTFLPFDRQTNETHERHGSLLFLRPVLINGQLYPLYIRMDGDVPGFSPIAAPRGRQGLPPPEVNAMDDFLNWLKENRGERRG